MQVLNIPELSPVSEPPADFVLSPRYIVSWKDGPRRACELSILAIWKPLPLRRDKLVTIVHWDSDSSGMILLDFSDPDDLCVVSEWHNNPDDISHRVRSGALQTVDVGGIAVRAGRHFLCRLEQGNDSLEFRVLGYSLRSTVPTSFSLPVPLPDEEWDHAEAHDSCTIFGRLILRQYDSSSDSEHSDNQSYLGLALIDLL